MSSSDSKQSATNERTESRKPTDDGEDYDSMSTRSGMSERRDSVDSSRSSLNDELDKTNGDDEDLEVVHSKSFSDFASNLNQLNGLTAEKVTEIFNQYRLSYGLGANNNGNLNA